MFNTVKTKININIPHKNIGIRWIKSPPNQSLEFITLHVNYVLDDGKCLSFVLGNPYKEKIRFPYY